MTFRLQTSAIFKRKKYSAEQQKNILVQGVNSEHLGVLLLYI